MAGGLISTTEVRAAGAADRPKGAGTEVRAAGAADRPKGAATTDVDAIFGGRVALAQPARGRGYRVNADALILADFAGATRGLAFDLGAGVGAVALVGIARGFVERAVLVDLDEGVCDLARRNIEANGARATVVCADVLAASRARRGEAALVVCNPPYFEPGAGRPSRKAAGARVGELERFVRAAREILGRRGRACFVYPARDLGRLFACARGAGLEPKRLRLVHATSRAPARVALVELRASKTGGLSIEPPLVERESASEYTSECARLLGLA